MMLWEAALAECVTLRYASEKSYFAMKMRIPG
jgi:hypothetical protein